MRKSLTGLAIMMAIIAVVLFMVLLVVQEIPQINRLFGIKKGIDILVNLNDEGSRVNALLNARTPEINVPGSIALHAAGYEKDSQEMQYIIEQAQIPGLRIYMPPSADGKSQEQVYGSTIAIKGYPVEIPLPGGGRGRMEVFLDVP